MKVFELGQRTGGNGEGKEGREAEDREDMMDKLKGVRRDGAEEMEEGGEQDGGYKA